MLPNSIQRTAPIVGYDPYAFIMGQKSMYNPVRGNISGGGLDYFAKKPEDMYGRGEKAKKGLRITKILKGALGLAAVIGGSALLLSGGKKLSTATPVTSSAGGASGAASGKGVGSKVLGGLKTAKDTAVNGARSFGGFVSSHARGAWSAVKNKFHRGTP